jgi:hypothetical protein
LKHYDSFNQELLISLFENLPLLFLSAPDHITMSSPAASVFQTVLPANAMGIDLIERRRWVR